MTTSYILTVQLLCLTSRSGVHGDAGSLRQLCAACLLPELSPPCGI